jgi:hypothetical protein
LTVTGRQGFATSTPAVTFTVDATNAKVMKNNATSTVANIAVGDTVMIQGKVTGTNIVATMIRDGQMPVRTPGKINKSGQTENDGAKTPRTPIISGNGQPVVAGKVTAINGTSLSITNASNVSYTVDATNAKIVRRQNTIAITNIAVGDSVTVQGTVNGSSITASSVIDQTRPAGTASTTAPRGMFGGLGQFFSHLFGF